MNKVARNAVEASSEKSRPSRSFNKPSWLLFSISDMEERMKMLASNIINNEEDDEDDDKAEITFAERAEYYYQKRPQLLALLQDIYNCYLSLADRYSQALAAKHHHSSSPTIPLRLVFDLEQVEERSNNTDSDAESSVSFEHPIIPTRIKLKPDPNYDEIIAELVIKTVEYEIVLGELGNVERRWGESSRKIELQRSLLEVLESERLILLNENARLGYRVTALVEENKALASECVFIKRKAGELAGRCMMREDHRVCMLSRKIEHLQGQIYGLEKRNKEYYAKLVEKEGGGSVSTTSLAHVIKGRRKHAHGGGGGGRKVSQMWDRLKKFDTFMCGPHFNSSCC